MRIEFNASGLFRPLTMCLSFLNAVHHSHYPSPPPAPVAAPSLLDQILPQSGRVRHLLTRGQSCNFFESNIPTAQNIHVRNDDRQFDCAIISIAGAGDKEISTQPPLSLRIFKERGAETYFVRSAHSGEFSPTGKPLNDAQLYWRLFGWGKACANFDPSIRIRFLDAMSDKPVPGIYALKRMASSLIEQLGTSLSRGFY